MKRARACWTTGEENSDKRRLWQVKTNQSDASLLCLLLRLLSVEIPMACVERPPMPQREGGRGLGMGFWTKTSRSWERCFDVINLCKVCFWLEVTHIFKKITWLGSWGGESVKPGSTACLRRTWGNPDRNPGQYRHLFKNSTIPQSSSAPISRVRRRFIQGTDFSVWFMNPHGEHPLGWGLFL